jgi:hypothetical protein
VEGGAVSESEWSGETVKPASRRQYSHRVARDGRLKPAEERDSHAMFPSGEGGMIHTCVSPVGASATLAQRCSRHFKLLQ